MSPRTGRPKTENPLNVEVKIRLSEEDAKRLDAYCAEHGITRTAAIRRAISLLLEA